MLLHLLAIPLGITILAVGLFVPALIASYPLESSAIVVMILLGYAIGAGILGIL